MMNSNTKKIISIIGMIFLVLFPYLYLSTNLIAKAIGGETFYSIMFLVSNILRLVALLVAALCAILGPSLKQVAIVKFAHIPYFLYDVIGPIVLSGMTTSVLAIMLPSILYEMITIFISGVYMMGLDRAKTIHKVLGFIYVMDLLALVLLFTEEKNTELANEL